MSIRRRLLSLIPTVVAAVLWAGSLSATATGADEPNRSEVGEKARPKQTVAVGARTDEALQHALDKQAALGGGIVRLEPVTTLTCYVHETSVGGERSNQPLLVPEGVDLDLNGGTLLLDLRSNSYGIRLSNDSAIRNGTIKVIRSKGKGYQAIWHSAVCVGAAYGDGGTVAKPGHFASVGNWRIEDVTIEQPFAASCIQLMSESHHGVIRNIRILDSNEALLGIGLDWGTVGPVTCADETVPQMRQLWEKNEISSTHPHHVLIENITIGKLERSVTGDVSGVRCSGCHHITIKNVQVESATQAINLVGGDFGFEFSPDEQRQEAHTGYLVDGVTIKAARLYGIILDGIEDNVYRSRKKYGYDSVRDPAHPGLNKPIIRNVVLRGTNGVHSRGVRVQAASGVTCEHVHAEGFETRVAVKDWVRGFTFRNGRIANNLKNVDVSGATEPPREVVFENNAES
jgi:hypothetical protein